MNIFWFEVRLLARSAGWWALSMVAVATLYLSLYPSIVADAEAFKQVFSSYPPAVRNMLGVTVDGIASLPGFFSMILTFVVLCGAIQATNAGVSLLSKEARVGTSDFLYSKPVSRATIVTAKVAAAVCVLTGTDLLYATVTWFLASGVANTGAGRGLTFEVFALMNLSVLGVGLMMFAVGLAVSLGFRRLRSVLPVSLGLVFGLYLVGALYSTDAEGTRFLSPFKYFDLHDIATNLRFEVPYLVAGAALIALGIGAAYVVTLRRDIHVS